jgi:enamine deaminase RidA (YjgF/YER057c/UK114 family)
MNERSGHIEDIYGARAAAYSGTPDVSQTVVQVGALLQSELKIEIKCIASSLDQLPRKFAC